MAEVEEKIIFTGDASQLQAAFDDLVNQITRTREELKQYKNDKEKSAELTEKLADQEMKLVKIMKENDNVIDASNVSYRQLNDILKDLNKTYRDTANAAQRLDIAPASKALNQELKTMDAAIGNYQRNVGNYAGDIDKAFQGLQLQTSQVLRELPSLKYGVEQFFLAISNNLPMLVDAVKKYSDLSKARKASAANAASDAATHRAEATETAESTAAHEGETKAVTASAAAHLKEAEAMVDSAKATLDNAKAAKTAALERRNDLMKRKEGLDMTIQEMMSNQKMAQSDQEHIIKLRELNTLKSESSRLDLDLATAENELAAAEIRERNATNQLTVAQKALDEQRKKSESTSWFKAMGKAILSWQTAVLALILALTLYSKEIGAFFERMFAGNKEMKRYEDAVKNAGVAQEEFTKSAVESTKAEDALNKSLLETNASYSKTAKESALFHKEQQELNKARVEGAKSFAKEYVEIRLLMSIMNEAAINEEKLKDKKEELVKVQEEHTQAAEKMLEKLGETVDETNIAAMKTGEYADEIDDLVSQLYKQAEAQGAIALLQKTYTETVLKAQGELIDAQLNRDANKFKSFWQAVGYYTLTALTPAGFFKGFRNKKDFLDSKVEKWEKKLGEAKTMFESFLAEITKMFDFNDLFGGDEGGNNSSVDKWFSRWEMYIKELEAKMGMLAEKADEVNLADTWKYSAEGLAYYMKKFDEYAEHYRKESKGIKDQDNKDLRELEVQRKQYLEEYYKYHNKLSKQYMSAVKTEKDYEIAQLLDWYKTQVALYQQAGMDITELDAEYELRMEKILDKYQTKYKYAMQEREALAAAAAGNATEFYQIMMDIELAKLQDTMDKEIKEYERKGIETTELIEHYAQEQAKIISKYAKEEADAVIEQTKREEQARQRLNNIAAGWANQGGQKRMQELQYAKLGGTTMTGHNQRQTEINATYNEYTIWKDSSEEQIEAMQRVLESGKLVGEQKLEMEAQLAEAERELALGTAEYQMELNQLVLDDTRETTTEMLGYVQSGFQGLAGAFDDVYTAIEKTMDAKVKEGELSNEEAEKQLEEYRGIKAAAAAMDALGSAVGAYNSLASIPYVGPALGAVAAAAALAAGFANVRLIMATTKDNAGSGSDSYANAMPSLSDYQPQYVTNITGKDDTDYLANALSEKPIQAYVVESDVTASQELANKRTNETTW